MTVNVGIKLTADGGAATAAAVKQVDGSLGTMAAKHEQASASSGKLAYQTTQLSNQLQDLFVQIQAGANPLTALIQQGSQVSAVYGGFGNAIKGVGALITPMTVAVGLGAAAVGGIAAAFIAGASESSEFRKSLALTNNAAGVTSSSMAAMAKSIADETKAGIGTARDVLQTLVSSGRVGAEAMQATGLAATAMAKATGQSGSEVAQRFAAMAGDVTGNLRKLQDQYHFLTAAEFEHIKTLDEQGQKQQALAEMMGKLGAQTKGAADQLGTLERSWNSVKTAASSAWDSMLDIGREQSLSQKIDAKIAEIERAKRGIGGLQWNAPQAQEQLAALQSQAKAEQDKATAAAKDAKLQQDVTEWTERTEKSLAAGAAWAKQRKEIEERAKAAGLSKDDPKVIAQINAEWQKSADGANAYALAAANVGAAAVVTAAKSAAAVQAYDAALSSGRLTQIDHIKALGAIEVAQMHAEEGYLKMQIAQAKTRIDNEKEVRKLQGDLSAKQTATLAREAQTEAQIDALQYQQRLKASKDRQAILDEDAAASASNQSAMALAQESFLSGLRESIKATDDGIKVSQLERAMAQASAQDRAVALVQLQAEIDLRRQLDAISNTALDPEARAKAIASATSASARKAAEATTRIYSDEWNKTFSEVQDGLYNALRNGGRDGWSQVISYIEGQVIKPVIQGFTAPLSAALTSAFLPGTAAAAGGSSAVSGAAGLAGIAGSISAATAGAGYGFASLAAGSGVAALGGAAEMAAAGQIASALGTVAGVLGPVALGIYALSQLDTKATPHTGGYSMTNSSGVTSDVLGTPGIAGIRNDSTQAVTDTLSKTLASALNTTAAAFGKDAAYSMRTVFESDNNDASVGMAHILINGIKQAGSFDATNLKSDPSAGLTQFSGMAAKGVADALQAIDLPKWANEALAKIAESDGADKLTQVVDQIVNTQKAVDALGAHFDGMGGIFGKVAALSSDVTVSLALMSGGIDKLATNLDGFYANFYSDAERSALSLQAVGKTLADVGIQTVPKTRAEFRKLVEGLDLSTDSGQKMFATLMGVAGAFADAVPAAEELNKKLKTAAEITTERLSLEGQLLELQGNTAELRAREAAQLDPSNVALYNRINALKDEKTAADAAKEATKKLADSLVQLQDGLRAAATNAMDVLTNTIQAQKDQLTTDFNAANGALDAQITAAKKAYDALLKSLDTQREAAKAVYDEAVKVAKAEREAMEADAKAIAKQYAADSKALSDERAATTTVYKAAIDALDKSITSQKKAVDGLRSLNDSLASTLAALNPIGSEAAQRSRAQAQIRDALLVAQTTGVLPSADDLKNALSTVAKPSEDLFGSFEDYLRDFYRTSLDIRDLGKIAGTQLDSATTQLDAMVALRDTTQAGYEAEMVRLDGIKTALDLANELAKEDLQIRADAISGKLDNARASYDATTAGLDSQQKAAKDSLDSQVAILEDQKAALKENYDKQIERLDGLLKYAKDQYDALMHIAGKADTIDTAMGNLIDALTSLATGTGQTAPTAPNGQPTSTPLNQWVTSGNVQTYTDSTGAVAIKTTEQLGTDAIVQGTNAAVFTVQDIRDFVTTHLASNDIAGVVAKAKEVGLSATAIDDAMGYTRGTFDSMVKGTSVAGFSPGDIRAFVGYWLAQGDARKVYDKATTIGLTSSSLDALMAWSPGTALGWATANGLPAFAGGGTFGGGVALVGEAGPELIHTGPARIYNNADTLAMLGDPQRRESALVTEIQRLRQEVADMRADNNAGHQATASSTGRTARVIVDRWEIDGMPPTRTTT